MYRFFEEKFVLCNENEMEEEMTGRKKMGILSKIVAFQCFFPSENLIDQI